MSKLFETYPNKENKYPEGAAWFASEGEWRYAVILKTVYKESNHGKHWESWFADVYREFVDGSREKVYHDWFPNKSGAFKTCREYMNKKETRFKRIA